MVGVSDAVPIQRANQGADSGKPRGASHGATAIFSVERKVRGWICFFMKRLKSDFTLAVSAKDLPANERKATHVHECPFPGTNVGSCTTLPAQPVKNQMPTCPFPSSGTVSSSTPSTPSSWLYLLEKFEVGVVHIDHELRVIGMNEFARRALPVSEKLPFGKIVTSFHPDAARSKVSFLLGQAECPVSNAPPMTMIINIPERVLSIKVSKMGDEQGKTVGYTLVFYDITEEVSKKIESGPTQTVHEAEGKRQLKKIPTVKQNRVLLVDVPSVSYIRSEGHYTWVHTAQGSQFCNLAIGDIESRLDPQLFLRVHRSYIINLSHVDEIVRDDGRMTLRMMGNTPVDIPVSRGSAPKLMEKLGIGDLVITKD
jgi:DNA-binding LytR/AlgR family response regulator